MTEQLSVSSLVQRQEVWQVEFDGEIERILVVPDGEAKKIRDQFGESGFTVLSDKSVMGRAVLLAVKEEVEFETPGGKEKVKLLEKVGKIGEDGQVVMEEKKES